MTNKISDFVSKALSNISAQNFTVQQLAGQASAREYYRIQFTHPIDPPEHLLSEMAPFTKAVVMYLPAGFKSPSDEIAKDKPTELPFLGVHRYLHKISVRVPHILAVDEALGMILLEDLGDTMLEQAVLASAGEFKIFYYRKALELLVQLQMKTSAYPDNSCISFSRRFDADLLNWEFDHFLEYGIEDRFQIKVSDAHKKLFHDKTRAITQHLLSTPQGFVHRDFQSRNLMLLGYELVLIDFQDALLGPVIYDLVALLRDSYIHFSKAERDRLIEEYTKLLPETHPYFNKSESIKRDFHLMTLQRKLKDTGRFQYILTVRKNPDFLKHVPLSLTYVKEAFEALPEYGDLFAMIAEYVPELRST